MAHAPNTEAMMVARTWKRTLVSSFTVKPHTLAWPVLASLSPFFMGEGVSSDPSVISTGGGFLFGSLGDESVPGMMDCIKHGRNAQKLGVIPLFDYLGLIIINQWYAASDEKIVAMVCGLIPEPFAPTEVPSDLWS